MPKKIDNCSSYENQMVLKILRIRRLSETVITLAENYYPRMHFSLFS